VKLEVVRGKRVVALYEAPRPANRTTRLSFRPRARGTYRVRITVGDVRSTLTARRL
jgi:hypothetical protein